MPECVHYSINICSCLWMLGWLVLPSSGEHRPGCTIRSMEVPADSPESSTTTTWLVLGHHPKLLTISAQSSTNQSFVNTFKGKQQKCQSNQLVVCFNHDCWILSPTNLTIPIMVVSPIKWKMFETANQPQKNTTNRSGWAPISSDRQLLDCFFIHQQPQPGTPLVGGRQLGWESVAVSLQMCATTNHHSWPLSTMNHQLIVVGCWLILWLLLSLLVLLFTLLTFLTDVSSYFPTWIVEYT